MAKFIIKRKQKQKNFVGLLAATAATTALTAGIKAGKDTKNILEGNTEELR